MKGKLVLVEAPAVEPITLEEARQHLRLDPFGAPATHPDDSLVQALITAARQQLDGAVAVGSECTGWLGRALVAQTWDFLLPAFPSAICLPQPPLLELVHIKYLDGAGTEQTLADSPAEYVVNPGEPALIVPAFAEGGYCWPATLDPGYGRTDVVRVRFRAGFPASDDSPVDLAAHVPQPIKAAIKLMVEDLYSNRGQVVVGTIVANTKAAESLLFPYRMRW